MLPRSYSPEIINIIDHRLLTSASSPDVYDEFVLGEGDHISGVQNSALTIAFLSSPCEEWPALRLL
jgi:hypothetical protein